MSYSVKALLRATGSVVVVFALCLLLVSGLAGCGGGDSTTTTQRTVTTGASVTSTTAASGDVTALTGKWYSERLKETLEFTSDSKMIWTREDRTSYAFSFSVEAGVIIFTQPNAPRANNIPFAVNGASLTTQDPKYGELTYTRQ